MNLKKINTMIEMQTTIGNNYRQAMEVRSSSMPSNYDFDGMKKALNDISTKISEELNKVEVLDETNT